MKHLPSTDATEIRELYRVFQPYRLGDDFVGCADCVSPTDSEHLAMTPLAQLSVTDLDRYAFKAMTTWGTIRHFKHFLPRLLELAYVDFLSFDFPETLLGKLAYAKWKLWPKIEREAVSNFLDQFWVHQIHSEGVFPNDERIRLCLGALAQANDSMETYLHIWGQQEHDWPALHLAQLIDDAADDIMSTGSIELWGDPKQQVDEIVRWLASTEALTLLDTFSDIVSTTFPFARAQLEGIAAARESH